jgi:hypothetical protein
MSKMTEGRRKPKVLCSKTGLGVRRRFVIRSWRTRIRRFRVNIGNLNRQDSQIISVMLS